jgi:ankyrin repeat protein
MMFNQERIVEIIRGYLIDRNRIELVNNLSPGYCYGLSLYFCDRAANKKLDSFYELLTTVAKWDISEDIKFLGKTAKIEAQEFWKRANAKLHASLSDMPIYPCTTKRDQIYWAREEGKLSQDEANLLLSTLLPDDPSIEKLLNNMEWLQSKFKLFSKLVSDNKRMDFLHELSAESVPHKKSFDFFTSMNFPRERLPELLAEFPLDRAIILGLGRHAVSCYRDSEGWQFYDSNNETKTPIRKTPEESAKDIEVVYETSGGIAGTHLPLGFFIFSNQNQEPLDTSKLSAICDPSTTSENTDQVTSQIVSDYPWDKMSTLSLAIIMNAPFDYIIKLIDQCADLTSYDSIGFQPLHYAVSNGRIDIVEYLLDKKIAIHQPIQRKDEKLTTEAQSFYLSLQGVTPLHLAVIDNNMRMVTLLLTKGADINAKTDMGLTPLVFAAIKGHEEMFQFLINQGANCEAQVNINDEMRSKLIGKTSQGITALERFGAIDASILENNANVAMCAATYKQVNTVLQCLDHGIDINAIASHGVILLHIAAFTNNIELAQALLNRGANIHALCQFSGASSGVTDALGIATLAKNLFMVELLLKNKMIQQQEIKVNATPAIVIALENTCRYDLSIIDTLEKLDQEQASLAHTRVCLDLAAERAYFAGKYSILDKMLANPYSKDLNRLLEAAIDKKDLPLIEKLVEGKKVNLDRISLSISSLCTLFQGTGREKIGALLLKNGLNMFTRYEFEPYRYSLIKLSLHKRFHEVLYPLILHSLENENKWKINELDESGNTFLQHAAHLGNNKVLEDLLKIGADPVVLDNENGSALTFKNIG